ATLPGLDGRKMSKSYDNTIPLFAPRARLQKLIGGIVTDSRAPGEPKDTQGSAVFDIYQAFADHEEAEAMRRAFADGIGWADAKQILFERIDREIAPLRAHYDDLLNHPAQIEKILLDGASKARAISGPFVTRLRHAVGLRKLDDRPSAAKAKSGKTARAAFKQYREADGLFYFKLLDAGGAQLLQSLGFSSPRDAAQAIATLRQQGTDALPLLAEQLEPVGDEKRQAVSAVLQELAADAAASEK
ncbi:MAG: tryptophan--tRNA ligase, partial [Gammaproteobacteria bacterium]|nr:tryptophan--tRNA ligase [Gammaproteobacteria bacterium]